MNIISKKSMVTCLLATTSLLTACASSDSNESQDLAQTQATTPSVHVEAEISTEAATPEVTLTYAGRTYDYSYTIVDTMQSLLYASDGQVADFASGSPLPQGQDGNYASIQASYVDNGDATITDYNTGLMWEIGSSQASMTYEEALDYTKTLATATYEDWRLPTIKELASIAIYDPQSTENDGDLSLLDTTYFETITGNLWSSNLNTNDNQLDGAYYYNTDTGEIATLENDTNTCYVKAVRTIDEDHTYGVNHFVDNQDGTITDLATGLTWQSSNDGIARDWDASIAYAENLLLAGYEDWRMPNAKELQSIVDYKGSQGLMVNTDFFNLSGDGLIFYTSTTSPLDGSLALSLSFTSIEGYNLYDAYGKGALLAIAKYPQEDTQASLSSETYVLCVRDNIQTTLAQSSAPTSEVLVEAPPEDVKAETTEVQAPSPQSQEETRTEEAPPTPPTDSEMSGPPTDTAIDTEGTSEDSVPSQEDQPTSDNGNMPPENASGRPQQGGGGGNADLSSLFDDYVTSGVLSEEEAEALSTYMEENEPIQGEDPFTGAVDAGIITQDQADAMELAQPPNMRN